MFICATEKQNAIKANIAGKNAQELLTKNTPYYMSKKQFLIEVKTLLLKTLSDYQKEIGRVEAAIDKTDSEHLKRDYGKYLKRLKRQVRGLCK